MRTTTHLHRAYLGLTEAQRNISHHRKEKHLCERCRESKKCDELINLAILENDALAKWIDAYQDASNSSTIGDASGPSGTRVTSFRS